MLNDFSGAPSSNLAHDLVQMFQLGSQRIGISGARPMILIPKEELASLGKIEERVLAWFGKQGFDGERDRKSNRTGLYPIGGYAKLLESLIDMPSQAYQERIDQTIRQSLPNRLKALDDSKLSLKREELEKVLDNLSWQSKKLPLLARILGSAEVIENLYTATVQNNADGYPAYRVADGTPDLFLWHSDPTLHLWFFAEVKGPGDSLRESQSIWFKENWERVQGRIMPVLVL